MKENLKKILSFVLVLCVLASMGIFTNAATTMNGNGGLKVINAKDGLFLSWNKTESANSYCINKYNPDTKKWSVIPDVTTTYYQDNDVKNGKDYIYLISCVDENGVKTSYKNGVTFKCLKMPTITLSCTPNSVMIVWNTFSTATEYRVYRKTVNDVQWQCIKVVRNKNTNYIMDYNVKQGQKYTYTIKQVNGKTLGSYNIFGVTSTYNKAPTVSSKHSPNGIVLNWNAPKTGNSYYIDTRSAKNTSWKNIATVQGKLTYTVPHNKSDYGVVNYYRIRVKNSNMVSYSTSVFGIDPKKPIVALTYDDGPYTSVTNSIVSTLKKNGARATFFVVGNRVNTYKNSLKNAYNAGCEIGNHTYDHYILTNYNAKTIKSQIDKTNNAVKSITGEAPTLVRAPGGSINSTVRSAVNYPLIQWSVDTLDWKSRNANSVISSVKNDVKDGSIILMHDLYSSTATATQTIVPWLKSQGYQMVTVTELMQIRGYDMKAGTVYYNGYEK